MSTTSPTAPCFPDCGAADCLPVTRVVPVGKRACEIILRELDCDVCSGGGIGRANVTEDELGPGVEYDYRAQRRTWGDESARILHFGLSLC